MTSNLFIVQYYIISIVLQIIKLLAEKQNMYLNEIHSKLTPTISRTTLSYHLHALMAKGVIKSELEIMVTQSPVPRAVRKYLLTGELGATISRLLIDLEFDKAKD